MKKNYQAVLILSLILFSAGVFGIFSTTYAGIGATGPIDSEFVETGTNRGADMDASLQESQGQQPMRSRQIIEDGELVELTGKLLRMSGSWLLFVDEVGHELYLAPLDYQRRVGLAIADEKEAVVNGYFYSEEDGKAGIIAVCTIKVDGRKFRIRRDDGQPMWEGRGRGSGTNSPQSN